MSHSNRPQNHLKKALLICFLSLSLLPRPTKSENFIEIIEAFFEIMVLATDHPGLSNEYRRRVTFKNTTTGKNHTGGVTVKLREPNMPARLYFYDEYKFGSRGKYVEFNINSPNDLQPGNVTNGEQLVKFSEFWFAAYADFGLENLCFRIESKAVEASNVVAGMDLEDKITGYLNNFKIVSVDKKYPYFAIEVLEVNTEPLSWVFRLVFYLFNFVLFIWVCVYEFEADKNGSHSNNGIPQRSAFVNFLVGLISFRLLVTYYFVPLMFFWIAFLPFSITKFCRFLDYFRQRITFYTYGAISVLFFLAGFVFIDIMPFFILFFTLTLTFDLLSDKNVDKKPAMSILANSILANFYIGFMFYNPGNHVYYYPDVASAAVWIPSVVILSIVNLIMICCLEAVQRKWDCISNCLDKCEGTSSHRGRNGGRGEGGDKPNGDIFDQIHQNRGKGVNYLEGGIEVNPISPSVGISGRGEDGYGGRSEAV